MRSGSAALRPKRQRRAGRSALLLLPQRSSDRGRPDPVVALPGSREAAVEWGVPRLASARRPGWIRWLGLGRLPGDDPPVRVETLSVAPSETLLIGVAIAPGRGLHAHLGRTDRLDRPRRPELQGHRRPLRSRAEYVRKRRRPLHGHLVDARYTRHCRNGRGPRRRDARRRAAVGSSAGQHPHDHPPRIQQGGDADRHGQGRLSL